jgi:uncharacterized protein
MLPPALVARYRGARKVVELAAGTRVDVALAWAAALPGVEVVLVDVDPRVAEAKAPLRGAVDDLLRPTIALYEGASLLYAVRLPEDLHPAALALARAVGVDLALRLLGDEAPAAGELPALRIEGWHLWPAPSSKS